MKNRYLLAWILFHCAILFAFVISLFVSPKITFGTSLFEILPPSSSLHEVQAADTKLGNKTSRAVTILIRAKNFENAKQAASKFYEKYTSNAPSKNFSVNSDFFDSLSLYVDSNSVAEISEWLFEKRFFLLSDEDIFLLENGGVAEIANDALSSVFGAFTVSDLSKLEDDPFLLSERSLKKFLENGAVSATNMTLHENVLACQKDDDWFVLIRGTVSEKGSALASKNNAVRKIYETASEIKKESEVDFIFSGVPFHSYESSTSAQAQISVISTVALILIVAAFLWIFRSIVPALVSALAVVFSCGIGLVSVLRGIHVLTFVFGTTLIGTCLDYSIHFFVNWKANPACENGLDVRQHILRGITLGFASTEICFVALFFASFPLLKQVSVFLFTGLATAYLSVVAIYPMLKMPQKRDNRLKFNNENRFTSSSCIKKSFINLKRGLDDKIHFLPLIIIVFSLIVIFINYRSLKIQNNIQELYSMSPKMLQNEMTSAKILDTGSSGWYFILKANSEENLLQKNEELVNFLNESVNHGKLKNFLSLAQFIPSEKIQMRSYKAAENFLPFAGEQYENLGFVEETENQKENSLAKNFENSYFALAKNLQSAQNSALIHASDSNLPATIREAISNLWIGEIDGNFYSCVLPLHAAVEEEEFFREYADSHEGIFFVNKVRDISTQLDILSRTMLKMLAFAFVVVIAILFFCYKPSLVFKIASVPILVTLVTTAILILSQIHLSFFPITALVLVFGFGLDYIIYAIEESEKKSKEIDKSKNSPNLTNFAIFLSFLTTALSFGALALSTFPPVHMLGLTVFVGLLTALVGAMCIGKN